MNGERVSTIEGKTPILIVAPHGYNNDDENTAFIAESIAKTLNCYAVVNHGWERASVVDAFKDKADCNNVTHCHEDVVKEEFLDPILRYRTRILKKHPIVHMYMLHGMADAHRVVSGEKNLDMVVGYGAGVPSSATCEAWRKNCFIDLLEDGMGFVVCEGKKGGGMSGWARNNMNQLFRKWYLDNRVQSMQLEIIHDLRKDTFVSQITAEYLGIAMKEMLNKTGFKSKKDNKQY